MISLRLSGSSLRRFVALCVTLGCLGIGSQLFAAKVHEHTTIFTGNTGGYHSYRIPSLICTSNGTLVAVVEGRASGYGDFGNINLVFKRSTNDGNSWSSLGEIEGNGQGSWTNPTMVYDPPSEELPTNAARNNGRIWIFFNWNSENETGMETIEEGDRRTYVSYSDDNGQTWANKVNMTSTLTPSDYTWDAVGPGNGIRVKRDPEHVGRLIVPATHRNFYSDDHGATWQYELIPGKTGEGAIVECIDGILMRNDRVVKGHWDEAKRRWVSFGTIEDGFANFQPHDDLIDPRCQASTIRYSANTSRIIFLNSASTVNDPLQEGRSKMRIRISYDEGLTWPISRRLYDNLTNEECIAQGKGGYSSMAKTKDHRIGILVEINPNGNYRSIAFHKVNLKWIRDGQSEP